MFKVLKGLYEGWKLKGEFPSVPPIFVKKFTDLLIDYQENQLWKYRFLCQFIDSDEDRLRCAFSYEVFGFSMGIFASSQNTSDEHVLCIGKAFGGIVYEAYKSHDAIKPAAFIPREEELETIYDLLTHKGIRMSFDEFKYANISKAHVFWGSMIYRAQQMGKSLSIILSTQHHPVPKFLAHLPQDNASKFLFHNSITLMEDITETDSPVKRHYCRQLVSDALNHFSKEERGFSER